MAALTANTIVPGAPVISGLARALVQNGRLRIEQADSLGKLAAAANIPFIDQLLQSKVMTPHELALTAAQTFGLPLLDLDAYDPAQMLSEVIDKKLMQSLRI